MATRTDGNASLHLGPTPTKGGRGARTTEEWVSLVRVLLLLTLIPALWAGVIPVAHPALTAIVPLLGGYVILLAIGPHRLAVLQRADLIIALDLLVITLIVIISGTLSSPFIYLYYLTILEAVARLNLRQALAASLAMAAIIIFLWVGAGHAGDLETTGFRLGALIAGGFLLALLLDILLEEYRTARERLEGLQFDNDLAGRLSGELRVEVVLETLLGVFLEATHLLNGVAYLRTDAGDLRLSAAWGSVWGEGGVSPENLPPPMLPQQPPDGELIIHPYRLSDGDPGRVLVCLPLVRGGQLRAWLCGLGNPPLAIPGAAHRSLHGLAAHGASALETARLHEKVRELAATDALTGLANRRSFLDRLTSELAVCRRTGRPLSIVLLDLDGFKAINDTHGHSVGDSALIEMAKLLTRNIRASDLAARFGGDELTLLFPETPAEVAERVLARLRATEIVLPDERGGELHLSFSWGIATWPQDGSDLESLLQTADRRLYAMKQPMRNEQLTPST